MHFTYIAPEGDLCQGDVLRRTAAVNAVLREVHPHYLEEDNYKLFMVLTQSCDLTRRGTQCGSRYIEIATVRPIEIVLKRQLEKYQDQRDIASCICKTSAKTRLVEFIQTLLNNNSSDYFFLYPEASLGFSGYMCAFLRESIPLRSYVHYETLLEARISSLHPTFQAKLGWSVGHIYSRVATDDWSTRPGDAQIFNGMCRELSGSICEWVDDKKLKEVKKTLPAAATNEEFKSAIAAAKSKSNKTEILERVCNVIQDQFPNQYPQLKNLQQKLSSDDALKVMLKD